MFVFQEDVLPSVKISQAAIESGYCKTKSCKRMNNIFNIT
ncbi:MAG: glucosaminidase domain-containing protein [Oleispira sp.]|nr:glucosaminidase domain-containing protein [Oleispira sp.]